MTTTQLKSSLHRLIDGSKNGKLLSVVYELLASDKSKSGNAYWWDTLTKEQKSQIEEALHELQMGKGIPHKEVMAKYKGKYI